MSNPDLARYKLGSLELTSLLLGIPVLPKINPGEQSLPHKDGKTIPPTHPGETSGSGVFEHSANVSDNPVFVNPDGKAKDKIQDKSTSGMEESQSDLVPAGLVGFVQPISKAAEDIAKLFSPADRPDRQNVLEDVKEVARGKYIYVFFPNNPDNSPPELTDLKEPPELVADSKRKLMTKSTRPQGIGEESYKKLLGLKPGATLPEVYAGKRGLYKVMDVKSYKTLMSKWKNKKSFKSNTTTIISPAEPTLAAGTPTPKVEALDPDQNTNLDMSTSGD